MEGFILRKNWVGLMATEQNAFNEDRLKRIEKRFEEIDDLRGKVITQTATHENFKGKLDDNKIMLSELRSEIEELNKQYLIEVNNPNDGIVVRLAGALNRLTYLEQTVRALELKFDTRIDKIYPEIEHFKVLHKHLLSFSGERLEKLEAMVKGNDKQKVWVERVFAAAISSAFALLVAFLKDC